MKPSVKTPGYYQRSAWLAITDARMGRGVDVTAVATFVTFSPRLRDGGTNTDKIFPNEFRLARSVA
jgi:hypothetical protein